MTRVFERVDRLVYRAERAFVVAALLVMALVVFLDVVHRAFAGAGSKLADAAARVGGWFGVVAEQGTPAYDALAQTMPWVGGSVTIALTWFAIRTATRGRVGHPVALGSAVVGVALAYGLVRALVLVLPNGLIWSQPLALVLTLWVGFVGASMATHDNKHLKVEALQRVVPPGLRKWVAFVAALASATFCLALAWVSLRYVRYNYGVYVTTEGQGGLFQGFDLPRWIGFSALPLAFTIMTMRFVGIALAALAGRIAEADPLAGLIDDAERPVAVPSSGVVRVRESQIATDRHHATDDREDVP